MAITRSWEASTALKLDFEGRARAPERQREFWLLTGASLLVACALALVLAAKTQDFADLGRRLNDRELHQLAVDMQNAPAGGDVVWIIGVVFIVLIILELTGVIDIFKKT